MQWHHLTTRADVDALAERSSNTPCLIFKHSTRCSISMVARHRLESDWDFDAGALEAYFLDIINYREVSNYIAEKFEVHHESPQVLLIRNGECYYDTSHLDISVAEIHECYEPYM